MTTLDEPAEPAPSPAATVVLIRDEDGGPEVLMARRNQRGLFGGYWVFPGGQVDEADRAPGGGELDWARRAGARETAEEVGLCVDAAALVDLSHWLPPAVAPRRFATWFFVCDVTGLAESAQVDAAELLELAWIRPADARDRRAAGTMDMAPPTWVTLWRMAQFASAAEAVGWARAHEPERFVSVLAETDGGRVLIEPGDTGYATGNLATPAPHHRIHMLDAGWRYERDLGDPPPRAAT